MNFKKTALKKDKKAFMTVKCYDKMSFNFTYKEILQILTIIASNGNIKIC